MCDKTCCKSMSSRLACWKICPGFSKKFFHVSWWRLLDVGVAWYSIWRHWAVIYMFSLGGYSKMFDSGGHASSIFQRVESHQQGCFLKGMALSETNSSPLKNPPRKVFQPSIFRCYVSFRDRHSTNFFSQFFLSKSNEKIPPNLLRVAWERGERSDGAGSTVMSNAQ